MGSGVEKTMREWPADRRRRVLAGAIVLFDCLLDLYPPTGSRWSGRVVGIGSGKLTMIPEGYEAHWARCLEDADRDDREQALSRALRAAGVVT